MADSDWMHFKQLRGKNLPERFEFNNTSYRLEKVFKRDFYAATGLYHREGEGPAPAKVVYKIYHTDRLGIIPLGWLGRRLCNREVFYYEQLGQVKGLTRLYGRLGESAFVREYIPGCHLREYRKTHEIDENLYLTLREQLAAIHAAGIAHNDLSKPENILVKPDGTPVIIDFQIASRFAWKWPVFKHVGRRILRYLQATDRYHLDKQHRRRRPQDFSADELKSAKKKGILLYLHGVLLRRPWRASRRFIMGRFMREKSHS
ncbi:MAG: hypothetical protein K8T89_06100 [Planctomycetes bacterium]|nr:hypothetical protein [Planctomycetota bacterium]